MVSYSIILSVILMRVDQCTSQICVIDIENMLCRCHTKKSVGESKIQKVHIYFGVKKTLILKNMGKKTTCNLLIQYLRVISCDEIATHSKECAMNIGQSSTATYYQALVELLLPSRFPLMCQKFSVTTCSHPRKSDSLVSIVMV